MKGSKTVCALTLLLSDDNEKNEELLRDLFVFILAANDTSSNQLTTVCYYLNQYPEWNERIKKEIDTEIGEDLSQINKENLSELPLLTQFLKECMRIDPVGGQSFKRRVHKRFECMGIDFIEGTEIAYNIPGLHRSESQWKSPNEFRPERFDPQSKWFLKPDGTQRLHTAFSPFSIGPRSCPGQFIAMLQMKILLILFIKLDMFKLDLSQIVPTEDQLSFAFYSRQVLIGEVVKETEQNE